MDELLASYLLDEAGPDMRAQVERWIASSPVNEKYFNHFRLIWDTSRQIALPKHIDEKQAWQRFKARAESSDRPAAVTTPTRGFTKLRIAAGILMIIGALTLAYFVVSTRSHAVVFASGDGAKADTLPDGSIVTLNKHSEITYPSQFEGNERRVNLKGEAFFVVAPDRSKPFTIHVNDVLITVVGTAFNVKSINGNTEVVVESGIVKVEKKNTEKLLTTGQKIIAGAKDSVLRPEKNTDALYSYYRSKEFICDNTPLWKLVTVLNEAYDVHIVVENKSLTNLPLTTTFSNESLDRVLNIIRETFNITIEQRQDTILLK